ncbi:MAG: hypothetical protein A3F53_00025 [Candidatus Zambryskibacteria bacterium RIFCSPHIGHO2_12_FULL_48_10]|uniref:DUF5667 domain-containing protein n=1 Tax=Candidatus Zambryskibacteria bacterium RIFCSPHIGHO2_01_FULL_46_25 TaxID=1802738 RepID=A0A1G2SZB4_9BACT|nr:MAG: hypothetical protein A2838_01905 [Candidatus Zambryskibacteria bacterium RIFCSPHIGHO2_01_FULL_46_25]OHB01267.1 MAG: hypothetical protein A3F53_00025 [Candidatus Zambryskibacteria bacterium RIFCSPHIGHO2_12_FULL_48_10]OHB06875.1 MAG: hypothetical protein A3A31_01055 [Candidatus Zambryskibacteria bacterium RIFCSPLOWO2_01_FULL_48_25]
MKKKTDNPEKILKSLKFRNLSLSESNATWAEISSRMESRSVFQIFALQTNHKNMIPLLIGMLVFISGGTAVAANSAVPGDILFPVDRAVENVRLVFSGKGKAELKVKFSEERLEEVEKLISRARLSASATTTGSTNSPQAATSTNATSTPKNTDGRVAVGVNVAISYLSDVAADLEAKGNTQALAAVESVIERLETMVNAEDVKVELKKNGDFMLKIKGSTATSTASTSPSAGKIKINTSGNKGRIEVKEEDGKFKIEIKDDGETKLKSETEIEIENDDNKDDDNDKNDDDRDNDNQGKRNSTSTLRLQLR